MVKELEMHRGNSLVVSGANDPNTQLLVNKINYILGNYGKTIDLDKPLNLKNEFSTWYTLIYFAFFLCLLHTEEAR